jgi:hypothetical protein
MHRSIRILERLIDITENAPLLFILETTVLNVFISWCGVPIVAPHKNVLGLWHALVVGTSRFAFATAGLSFGNFGFLSFSLSCPLFPMDCNLIDENSVFIRNKPMLALRQTRTTYERERGMESMGISTCT